MILLTNQAMSHTMRSLLILSNNIFALICKNSYCQLMEENVNHRSGIYEDFGVKTQRKQHKHYKVELCEVPNMQIFMFVMEKLHTIVLMGA